MQDPPLEPLVDELVIGRVDQRLAGGNIPHRQVEAEPQVWTAARAGDGQRDRVETGLEEVGRLPLEGVGEGRSDTARRARSASRGSGLAWRQWEVIRAVASRLLLGEEGVDQTAVVGLGRAGGRILGEVGAPPAGLGDV